MRDRWAGKSDPTRGIHSRRGGWPFGADTLSGGAVIPASTRIPAFITASAGVPALGAGPALAPSFGGTLLLFALQFFWWASLCVLTGVTSAGFFHPALLGFILSYIWPHLTKVPLTPSGLISQVVKVNLLWRGNTLLNVSFQVGQSTRRWPQVLGHFWWQHHLSWGRIQKRQGLCCCGHFSVRTLLSASLSLYSTGQTRSVWGRGRGFSYLICVYHAQDGSFFVLLSLSRLFTLILHFDDLLLLYNNIGAGGLWHWLCCGWHPGGCRLCCRCWGLWWLAHYRHGGICRHCHRQSFVGMGIVREQWEGVVNIAVCPQTPRVDLAILDYATMVMPLYNITGSSTNLLIAFFHDAAIVCCALQGMSPMGLCWLWMS